MLKVVLCVEDSEMPLGNVQLAVHTDISEPLSECQIRLSLPLAGSSVFSRKK